MSFSIPNQSSLIKLTPTITPTYSGAPDWISITGVANNEIIFLVSDATNGGRYSIQTTFTKPGSENIYIDWGDGVIDTIAINTSITTIHTFTTGGTACSRGYNTWKVRVYGDAGTTITQAQVVRNSTDALNTPSGLLQAWYGDTSVNTMNSYFNRSLLAPSYPYLEYVKLPNGVTISNGFVSTFEDCKSLQKVDLPSDMSAITTLNSMFRSCSVLYEINEFPSNMTGVTSMNSTFEGAASLPRITFRNTFNLLTDISRCFSNCGVLGYLTIPELPICTNYNLTYSGCWNLRSISLPTIPNTFITMDNMLLNNYKLQNIYLDPTTTATLSNLTFRSCVSIRSITLPPNATITSYLNMFDSCRALVEVSLPMNASGVTSFVNIFNQCQTLQNVTLPSIAPVIPVSFAGAFAGCSCLSEVIIPSTYSVTSLNNTFDNCLALQNVSIPDKPTVTDLVQTFRSCFMLEQVTLPTILTGVTSLSATFQNCYSIKEITLPSVMDNVLSMSNMCNTCNSLTKITLPTSMSSLAGSGGNLAFVNSFLNCNSLKSLVLPNNINGSIVTNNSQFVANCFNLETLSLPAVPMTAITASSLAFSECKSLTGITNIEYMGSSANTTTNYVNGTALTTGSLRISELNFNCKFSKLELQGTNTGVNFSRLSSLRLLNNGSGQYAGTSPQINISFTDLSQAALVQVFNDLPTVTGKTINITSATGASSLTAGERAIATGKGWTIVG
jgi:hypothetical protein